MNPWLLHEVRKDDVAARYKDAERSRLAATVSKDSSQASLEARASTGSHRLLRVRRAYWVAAGLGIGLALITVVLTSAL